MQFAVARENLLKGQPHTGGWGIRPECGTECGNETVACRRVRKRTESPRGNKAVKEDGWTGSFESHHSREPGRRDATPSGGVVGDG